MDRETDPGSLVIRTAVAADLPELQRVFRAASLSNAGDAPALLARPEFLLFTGDGISAGRTRVAVAGPAERGRLVGFATVAAGEDAGLELEDMFTDPDWHRKGVARRLIDDVVDAALRAGYQRLTVTGNDHALAFYTAVGFTEVGLTTTELGPARRLRLDLANRRPAGSTQ